MDTAAVIANAMTDYLLASGTNKAPATRAPAHMAAWLDARGYRIVRSPAPQPVDPGNERAIAQIVSSIDWRSTGVSGETRNEVVRQVVDALKSEETVTASRRRTAWTSNRYASRLRPTVVRPTTACSERTTDTEEPAEASTSSSAHAELPADGTNPPPYPIEFYRNRRETTLRSVPTIRAVPDPEVQEPRHASVELPDPIHPDGYAERDPYKVTWAGGVHLLGARLLVIPCRTLDRPEEAREHAGAVLAAAARMKR